MSNAWERMQRVWVIKFWVIEFGLLNFHRVWVIKFSSKITEFTESMGSSHPCTIRLRKNGRTGTVISFEGKSM